MKFILSLIFASFLITDASANITTDAEAINKAGRQRMLSQRITKSYIMIGSDIKLSQAKKQLDESMALFEEQFLELQDYSKSKEIDAALDKVSAIWGTHRLNILQTPTKAETAALIKESDDLLEACHQVVVLFEKQAGNKAAKMVNISGRQRMLSQRIAKLYMAMSWKVDMPDLENSIQQAINDYEKALTELSQFQSNTGNIQQQLKKVSSQWAFSKAGFSQHKKGVYVPTLIAVTTESMLKKMNALTRDYEKLMGSL